MDNTTSHENDHFRNDNVMVFNLMKLLIYNDKSVFWPFASRFNDAKEGRSAFLTMKRQAKVTAAQHS
jgi:hypothetical protein